MHVTTCIVDFASKVQAPTWCPNCSLSP